MNDVYESDREFGFAELGTAPERAEIDPATIRYIAGPALYGYEGDPGFDRYDPNASPDTFFD